MSAPLEGVADLGKDLEITDGTGHNSNKLASSELLQLERLRRSVRIILHPVLGFLHNTWQDFLLVCGPSSGANDLLDLVNSRIRFPRQCTIPMECTLAMREVDIAMGWKLVDSPQVKPLNNPACLLHWTPSAGTAEKECQDNPSSSPRVPPQHMAGLPEPRGLEKAQEFRTGQLVGVMASSIRDLQVLAQQHFSVRDPVIATDGAALIGSDGYLMSLRQDAVVVAVHRSILLLSKNGSL
jgi:hypothetical protein